MSAKRCYDSNLKALGLLAAQYQEITGKQLFQVREVPAQWPATKTGLTRVFFDQTLRHSAARARERAQELVDATPPLLPAARLSQYYRMNDGKIGKREEGQALQRPARQRRFQV